jgi:hypothetical protein
MIVVEVRACGRERGSKATNKLRVALVGRTVGGDRPHAAVS